MAHSTQSVTLRPDAIFWFGRPYISSTILSNQTTSLTNIGGGWANVVHAVSTLFGEDTQRRRPIYNLYLVPYT